MRIILITFFFITSVVALARDRIQVNEYSEFIEISDNTLRFTDSTKSLDIKNILSLPESAWKNVGLNGFTQNVEWAQVLFENNTDKDFDKVLYLNNLFTYEAEFHFIVNGVLQRESVTTGLSKPFNSKLYADPMYPIKVHFPAKSTVDVYIKVRNPMSTTNTPLFLISYAKAADLKETRMLLSFFWAGILTLSLTLSLFLYISIRRKIFLNYLFLGIGTFMFCSANLGVMLLFLESDPYQYSLDCYQIGAALILIFMPRFLNGIVPIAKINLLAWRVVKTIGYMGLTIAVLYVLPFFKFDFFFTTLVANSLTGFTAMVFFYLLVALSIAAFRRSPRAIGLFLVYLVYLGIAFGAVLLPLFGSDNNGLNTFFLILGGSIFETIAFMLMMAKVTLAIYKERVNLYIQVQNNQKILMSTLMKSQEDERKRFAQDLHDGFGQLISSFNLNLSSLETIKKSDSGKRLNIFQTCTSILDDMYIELKNICFNLMPQTLIMEGLSAALKEFATRINQCNKIRVEILLYDMDDRLSQIQEISLYRISQEWINNIIKYSNATHISLQLTKDTQEVTLLIEDNGRGFNKSKLESNPGNGWKNIHSRANLIKGELELDTNPNTIGTTFILNSPLQLESSIKTIEPLLVS